MDNWEIHCPDCGVLVRTVKYSETKSCPDCGCTQAIFLSYWFDPDKQLDWNEILK